MLGAGDDVELYLDVRHPAAQRSRPAAVGRGQRSAGGGALARHHERGRARRRLPGDQLAEGRCRLTAVIDVAVVDDHPIILESAASWIMADSERYPAGRHRGDRGRPAGRARGAGPTSCCSISTSATGPPWTATWRPSSAAGPAVLVLSASDRPVAVRTAMRAGARGYVLKNEQPEQIRAAIREVAAGRDWISARLAYIFATDDTADLPALSQQERRTLELYATGLALEIGGEEDGHQRGHRKAVPGARAGEIRECRTGRANENGALLSSSRGRVSPPASIDRCPPSGHGVRIHPSSALARTNLATARSRCHDPRSGVMGGLIAGSLPGSGHRGPVPVHRRRPRATHAPNMPVIPNGNAQPGGGDAGGLARARDRVRAARGRAADRRAADAVRGAAPWSSTTTLRLPSPG